MKKYLWFLCSLACIAWMFAGCSTTQTELAFKTEQAADLTVQTAMTGWGTYVALEHPGTNTEAKVLAAFNIYKNAELALVDATASLASEPTNTAPLTAAQSALAASQASLLSLITSLTNTP